MHTLSSRLGRAWSGAPGRILLFLSSVACVAAQPRIFFSDLVSGPNTGGQNNQGVFVTIYGARFGATRGGSSVTVGGNAVANYPVWTDKKVTFQLGSAAATGEIKLNTSEGTSNGVPFTVRAGNIYFVSPSGSDTAAGSFDAPWRTAQKAVNTIAAGDTIYLMNGLVETRPGTSDGSVGLNRNFGAAGRHKALIGYPAAVATIGSVGTGPCTSTGCIEGLKVGYAGANWTIANLRLLGNDYGIVVRGDDYRIVGNELTCPHGNGATACLDGSQATNVKVFGNNVHDVGFDRSSALYHGIYFSTDSNLIEMGWNSLTNVKGCRGIQIHSSRLDASSGLNQYGIDIHDNFIKDTQCDAIVLATIDPSKGPIRIYNNVIVNGGRGPITVEGGGNYSCIYVAGYTNNGPQGSGVVDIFNNTMVNCGSARVLGHGGVTYARRQTTIDVQLRNNIIRQETGVPYFINYDSTIGLQGANNILFGNGAPPANPLITGTINQDPRLLSANDYHLQSGSPAIGAGVANSLATDYDGRFRTSPPDIGAYQFAAGVSAPPPPTPQPAQLSLSPAAVSASGTAGGSNPAARQVSLTNVAGGATATWSAASNQPWVTLTPASGSIEGGTSAPLSVGFNIAGLATGKHAATITITGGSAPTALTVQLDISAAPAGPVLNLSTSALNASFTVGGSNPSTQRIMLKNDGSATASWSAAPNQTWLRATPATGSLAPGASQAVDIACTAAGLPTGTNTANVSFSGGATLRTLSYTLEVTSAPSASPSPRTSSPLVTNPTTFALTGVAGGADVVRTMTIKNTGSTRTPWMAVGEQGWLRITPSGGYLNPGESVVVTVTARPGTLRPAIHNGSIMISATSASWFRMYLTFRVTSQPITKAAVTLRPIDVWVRPQRPRLV